MKSKAIKPITYMKMHSADLLNDVKSGPIVITRDGEAKAILLDVDDFEGDRNALILLRKLAMGEADIKNGAVIDQDEVFHAIEKDLGHRIE